MDLSAPEIAAIFASGLATGVGGLALLVVRRPSPRLLDALMGFTAGIMLAAAIFSLLVPALDRGSLGSVVTGFVVGAGTLAVLDAVIPHVHARLASGSDRLEDVASDDQVKARRRSVLLLSALTIHNLPEGMAVGLAFAAGGPELGVPTAIAIGSQNVPEGFAAAAPLLDAGASKRRSIGFAALTGAVEPPAALAAAAFAGVAVVLLVPGLAFAAGAMIYVVVDELIPEAHAGGYEREATLAMISGFVLMLVLDNALA